MRVFAATAVRTLCVLLLFGAFPAARAALFEFTDRTLFIDAATSLGIATVTDNFTAYPEGSLVNGQVLGVFRYTFDPAVTHPGIASNGAGGRALGDTSLGTDPNLGTGVFVGGEAVTLTFTGQRALLAFGADFFYAPAFESLPSDLYQVQIRDGNAAGTTLGNPAGLPATGGPFFLGFIGDGTSSFTQLSLQSVAFATDPDGNPFLVPAYQIDDLIFGTAAPVAVSAPFGLPVFLAASGLWFGAKLLMRGRRRTDPEAKRAFSRFVH